MKLRNPKESRNAIAIHCFYADIAERIIQRVTKNHSDADIWLTAPPELEAECEALKLRYCPNAQLRILPNTGFDVLPFLLLLPELSALGYKSVLKLHTKRGADESSAIWGKALVDTVTDPQWINYAFSRLAASPALNMIGPGQYFCSAKRLMLTNRRWVDRLLCEFPDIRPTSDDWGFFIGTMFGVCVERLMPLAQWACENHGLFDADYQNDGLLAHALERTIALFAKRSAQSIGLIHEAKPPGTFALQQVSVQQGLNQASSRQIARELSELTVNAELLRENGFLKGGEYSVEGVVEGEIDLSLHYLLIGQFDNRRAYVPAWALKRRSDELPWSEWRQVKRASGMVSIVIPVFNEPDMTEHCVRTIFSVNANVPFEVICVDNGSEVATQKVLDDLAQDFDDLKVVRNEKNLNFALGCNIGFGCTRGEYVVFLNNDTEVQPNWLDVLVNRLAVGDCYGVQPQLLYPDGRLQCLGVVFSEKSTLGYPIYSGSLPAECKADKPRVFKALTAACLGLRADYFIRVRGFDAIFINGQEDIDLCLRLHQLTGKLGAYEPKSVVIHHESESEGRFTRLNQNRKIFVHRWEGKIAADDRSYYRDDGFEVSGWVPDSANGDLSLRVYRPTLTPQSVLTAANRHTLRNDFSAALLDYVDARKRLGPGFVPLDINFDIIRRRWLMSRSGEKPKVVVCCWELAHNPAGRAMTLAEAWQPHADVAIVGCLIPSYGRTLWGPLQSSPIACHSFVLEHPSNFVDDAFRLVSQHPADIVHLSKPRMHNVIFGWLYQLIWGARVVMDVDDEELGFAKADSALDPFEYMREHGELPPLKDLRSRVSTQLAVGMVHQFDGVTVSNPALQSRYGGQIIPHVRPAERFVPSPEKRFASRKEFDVPLDKYVVLFYGTPRKHKGVAETARALAALGRDDVCYVIAGGEVDAKLRSELDGVSGVDYIFLGPQPYERTPDVVAMGDVSVLLQDVESQVAQFQLPAKLMDALGMGLTVFAQVTPALEELASKGAFVPVTSENLTENLQKYFQGGYKGQGARGRAVFESDLTVDAVAPIIRSILDDESPRRAQLINWDGQLDRLLKGQLPKGVPLPPTCDRPE